MNRLFPLFLLCFEIFDLSGQSISNLLEDYSASHHLEKLYIHHNQEIYTPGDTIWSKVYFVDGRSHQFFEKASPLIHIEWYDQKDTLLNSYLLKISDGSAEFDIPIPYDAVAGEYQLKAYTNYQRNFEQDYLFQKSIQIINDVTQEQSTPEALQQNLNYSVVFYPEGGNIVADVSNKVAFKGQNFNGNNIDLEAILKDEDGNEISKTKTYNEGIGYVEFTPQSGKKYQLITRHNDVEKSFELPKAMVNGYVLSVDSRNKAYIIIQIKTNKPEGLANSTLIGHTRGNAIIEQKISADNEISLKLPRIDLPSGIIHFTLFDPESRPRCERLVFNKNPNHISPLLTIQTNEETFQKREKVKVQLSLVGETNEQISSSLTVTNNNLLPDNNGKITIQNYLLLQSDLKGRLNNINQYFIDNSTKTNFFLDLVMMTHGWSRFTWTDIMEEQYPSLEYGVKDNITLVGQVTKKGKPVQSDVIVSTLNDNGMATAVVASNADGIFLVEGLDFTDTMDVIIQSSEADKKQKKKEGEFKQSKKNNVDLELLTLENPPYDRSVSLQSYKKRSTGLNQIITNFRENRRLDSLYNPTWALELDEFYVKAQKKTTREKKLKDLKERMSQSGMFYFPSSQKIFLDDLPGGGYQYQNVFEIVRGRAPGVIIDGSGADRFFVIRGSTNFSGSIPALVLLDGAEIYRPADININPDNILAIDIIKGLSSSAVYGERGAGGAISIITKDPTLVKQQGIEKEPRGTLNFRHSGIYNAREYYSPNYAVRSIDHQRPDLRTCLYWDPDLEFKKGKSEVSFYAGDKPGKYTIQIEGITGEGIPFVMSHPIEIVE